MDKTHPAAPHAKYSLTKPQIVERLRYLGCPAVMFGSVSTVTRTYPKSLLEKWLSEYETTPKEH